MNTIDEIVRVNRLRWWDHVTRMGHNRLPKRLMNAEAEGKRSRGKPMRRWLASVQNDFKLRGFTSDEASQLAPNRGSWRALSRGLAPD